MADPRPTGAPGGAGALFELKSTSLAALALHLKSGDLAALAAGLDARFGATPGLFVAEPLCLDLTALREAETAPEWADLLPLLRRWGFNPVAARGGNPAQMAAALAAGLAEAAEATMPAPAPAAPPPPETPTPAAVPQPAVPPSALVIDKPLRSGQQVYARGRDAVVLSVVSHGAEVIADGHIHVYGPLRGRALAGAQGDTSARIFAAAMEPQLVSIAGTWRTFEAGLPEGVAGRPAQVRLVDDRLVFEPMK
ncbi:MAG: septum site-determining protein MinC [Proteobacteria bacterium]|nr:septum site-determining protein MinC [Pseudomonadota bacterium]